MNLWLKEVSTAVALSAFAATSLAAAEADLVLTNGQVYTPAGWASAVAVKGGVIVAVGDEAAIQAHKGPATEVMDLGGDTVLPGLHDMHVHGFWTAVSRTGCLFPQDSSVAAIVETVKACVGQRQKGEWITGGSWMPAMIEGQAAVNRQTLDAVAPDNPVALRDFSFHSLWVNSKALELAGITRDTPDPAGGSIERDADGEPTGLLREHAIYLVNEVVPPLSAEQNAAALKAVLDLFSSYGITSFTDAMVNEAGLQTYAALSDAGELKQRVKACMPWVKGPGEPATGEELIARRNEFARPGLDVSCVKMMLDGVPFDARTAVMLEPYEGAAHETDRAKSHGVPMIAPEDLNAAVTKFDAAGLSMVMHATGDGAVREALDAIAAARKANGWSGQMHQVSHANFVHPDDLARAGSIGATFEFSPYVWFPVPPVDIDVRKAVGDARVDRFDPFRDAIDAGALVVPGSDWEVVPSVNPWPAIETLVTRQLPGGSEKTIAPSQRVSLKEAVDIFTVNAATQMQHRDQVGSIEPGMLADLVVIDRNPFKVPITEVGATQVKMTLIGGEVVYPRP